ncbi:MAG: choice-of-anchor tandem repeat GloVer-containing protein [Candidatus Korobacteraceae bacterium]
MRDRTFFLGWRLALAIFSVTLLATSTWAADRETVLHSFGNGTDGADPYGASLIFDAAGNLYGTTRDGGIHGEGTVFKLSPKEGGGWTETVLHSFENGTDGADPLAGLIFDAAGNLYGTTWLGGLHGFGTVFELSPHGGSWTETVLHSFGSGTDGTQPLVSLIFDAAGNLYGTTYEGGIHGAGTVFELSPGQGGGWTEKVLHSFGSGTDGAYPLYGVSLTGSAGNLYGTTYEGGIHGLGTVFELSPSGGGNWTEKVLHSFGSGADGASPYAELIFDTSGNLYGTTFAGGIHSSGTVFELSPSGGDWTEKVLHSFGNGTDGTEPFASLIDAAGNIYGTTIGGGLHGAGTAFELSPRDDGSWTETELHSFSDGSDGGYPYAGLIFDRAGNLYGTTWQGGIHGAGTAFEITP